MKKHIVFSFGVLICLLFGITTTIFAQVLNQRTTNEYYPTDGPIQIIKSSTSTVSGEGTQITMNLDFSDDTAFGIAGKKYQVSTYETKNSKKISSGDFNLNTNKVLSGTITGLIPETDYTLFIKPYINSVATDAKMSIAVRTNKPTTILKQFSYGKNITSSKTIITLIATYEGVPEGEVVTFTLTNADTTKSKVDLKPTDTLAITQTTKQYTLENISTAGNEGKVISVTVTLKNKEGLLFTQTKTVPDVLNGQQTNTSASNKTLASTDDYQFLTKLPGFNTASLCKEKDAQGNCLVYNFNEYLQALIKLTYSLIALIAIFQIIYYGAKTMWSVTPFGKSESKDRIINAIMGIVIALGSYLILYTINPKLVTIHLGAPKVDIVNKNGTLFSIIGESQVKMYDAIGGVDFKRTDYYNQIKTFVTNMNYSGHTDKIPHCLAQVAIQRESAGHPDVVGHDENVASADIGSRVTFINSGKKQSGATFTVDSGSMTKTDLLNDDVGSSIFKAKNPSANDLGLDWRFSHGIGLKQITFFPTGSTAGANWDKGAVYPITTTKTAFPKDMMDPNNAIQFGIEMLQVDYEKCGKDVVKTYKMYGIGSCDTTNTYVLQEAATRKKMYDQCLAQDN